MQENCLPFCPSVRDHRISNRKFGNVLSVIFVQRMKRSWAGRWRWDVRHPFLLHRAWVACLGCIILLKMNFKLLIRKSRCRFGFEWAWESAPCRWPSMELPAFLQDISHEFQNFPRSEYTSKKLAES